MLRCGPRHDVEGPAHDLGVQMLGQVEVFLVELGSKLFLRLASGLALGPVLDLFLGLALDYVRRIARGLHHTSSLASHAATESAPIDRIRPPRDGKTASSFPM